MTIKFSSIEVINFWRRKEKRKEKKQREEKRREVLIKQQGCEPEWKGFKKH